MEKNCQIITLRGLPKQKFKKSEIKEEQIT